MGSFVKVAITIPREQFARVERVRRGRRQTRSRVIAEALQTWLDRSQESEDVRRYVESYRRQPEGSPEARAWSRLGLARLAHAGWD